MDFLKCPSPRPLIIPIVLCAMAVVQRYHAEVTNLHPWKGGGFGMFAAVPPTHLLTVKTRDMKNYYKTPTPPELNRFGRILSVHPTPARAKAFGEALLEQQWFLIPSPDGKFPVTKERAAAYPDAEPVQLVGAEIQVSRYRFEKEGFQMVHEKPFEKAKVGRP